MSFTETQSEAECEVGTGDQSLADAEICRTTPTDLIDIEERVEAECIFPFTIEGKEFNFCAVSELLDFTRPWFVCPIRTIKGRGTNYNLDDVDAGLNLLAYCPSEGPVYNDYNGQLELDPDNSLCLPEERRVVFATCKNTCPGGEEHLEISISISYLSFQLTSP